MRGTSVCESSRSEYDSIRGGCTANKHGRDWSTAHCTPGGPRQGLPGSIILTRVDPVSDLSVLAGLVTYAGSAEHKRFPNPIAKPELRSDASDCDLVDQSLSQDPARLLKLLREIIGRGQVDPRRDGMFPRYGWGWIRGSDRHSKLVEVRVTNSTLGAYKGYFIDDTDLVGKKAWLRKYLLDGGPWSGELE